MERILMIVCCIIAMNVHAQKNFYISPEVSFMNIKNYNAAFEGNVSVGKNFQNGSSVGVGVGLLKLGDLNVGVPVFAKAMLFSTEHKISPLGVAQVGYFAVQNPGISSGIFFKFGLGLIAIRKMAPYINLSYTALQVNTFLNSGICLTVGMKI